MRNSLYFNSPSMTRRKNNSQLIFLVIILLILISYIAIPQVINSAPITDLEVEEQITKVIPLPDLNKIKIAQQQAESEQEVAHLLHQEYLDPLAKYLETNHFNEAKAPYVNKVSQELEQRCSEIEKRYQTMKKDQVSLKSLRKGYGYACPIIIDRLAKKLTK